MLTIAALVCALHLQSTPLSARPFASTLPSIQCQASDWAGEWTEEAMAAVAAVQRAVKLSVSDSVGVEPGAGAVSPTTGR